MNGALYSDLEYEDISTEIEDDPEAYDLDEVNEMLDELADASEAQELTDRKRRGRQRRAPQAKGIPIAQGINAYRPPAVAGFVTQKQLQDALSRVGADVRRNAQGIKAINTRINSLNGRVDGVVDVNRLQSREIGKLNRQMRADGALDIVGALTPAGLDAFQLLKGAVKSGVLGEQKGALANPWVLAGIGLLLRNPNVLGGVLQPSLVATPTP